MIKVAILALGILAVPAVMVAPPAKAYDPCERATRAYEQAVRDRNDARECRPGPPRVCTTPIWAAEAVYDARVRMARACSQ